MMSLSYFKPAGKAVFKDRFTTKANELLTDWEPGMTSDFGIVGVPLSKSSISHSGAAFAPEAIRSVLQSYTTFSGSTNTEFRQPILDFGDIYMNPTDITENQLRAYEGMLSALQTEAATWWVILGGDHSISYSAIKAFQEHYGKTGIIQFDAHHDLRNMEDGGPTNGTPFRRLLEDRIIDGKHLVQIGIRDFTNAKEYLKYAKEQNVTVYTMEDVGRLSVISLLEKELARLADQVDIIYLSVDMDVLDQAFAPGCPAIGPGGMDSKTLLEGISFAAKHNKVQAMDIVEIDPTMDFRNMTSRLAAYILFQFMLQKINCGS